MDRSDSEVGSFHESLCGHFSAMAMISLRSRMILVAVGATVAGCLALIAVGYRINVMEVEEALRGRAGAIAERLDLFVKDGSGYQTQESVDRMLENQSFVAAVVFSPGREVVASSPSTSVLGPVLSEWPTAENDLRKMEVDGVEAVAVAVPLVTGGQAWVVFNNAPYAAAEMRLQRAWAVVASGATLIALLISLLAGSSVKRQLGDIRDVVARLRDGDLGARCAVGGPAEVQEIARGINEMASMFDGTMNTLGQERSALEQQVSGRTRELEQANRLLMDIANRDALTGLANRRRLEMELERNISFSKRTGQPLAVIMMDLDNFKIVNDTAGHLVGDNILRAVASTLRSRVRVTDLVVRWGGDEFCILVPATQPQGAIAAAESLVDAVKEATSAVSLPEPLEPPTASAGVACFPEDGEDPHTLILNADAALYQVKATGRGRVLRYSPGFSKD
jgi:diguanylate cyclase (GGDEF)-like protein